MRKEYAKYKIFNLDHLQVLKEVQTFLLQSYS